MLSCENFCCEEMPGDQRLIDGGTFEVKIKKSSRFVFAKKEKERRKTIVSEGNSQDIKQSEVHKGKETKETTEKERKRRDTESRSKSNIEISTREPPSSPPPPKSPRNEANNPQSLIDKLFKVKKSRSQQFKEAAISGSHSHSLSQLKADISPISGNSPPHVIRRSKSATSSCASPDCKQMNDGYVKCVKHCTTCFRVAYCSEHCKITHWPDHKHDCKDVAANAPTLI